MAHKYCTLWYPTIYHKELGEVCGFRNNQNGETTGRIDIKDDSKEGSYYLTLTLYKNGTKEFLRVRSELENRSFVVDLTLEDYNRDGFALYSFPTVIKYEDGQVLTPDEYKKFESILKRSVYAFAKQFYHIHEADNNRDCGLTAFITRKRISLDKPDHLAMIWYMQRFCDIFKTYACDLSRLNKIAQEREMLLD